MQPDQYISQHFFNMFLLCKRVYRDADLSCTCGCENLSASHFLFSTQTRFIFNCKWEHFQKPHFHTKPQQSLSIVACSSENNRLNKFVMHSPTIMNKRILNTIFMDFKYSSGWFRMKLSCHTHLTLHHAQFCLLYVWTIVYIHTLTRSFFSSLVCMCVINRC